MLGKSTQFPNVIEFMHLPGPLLKQCVFFRSHKSIITFLDMMEQEQFQRNKHTFY